MGVEDIGKSHFCPPCKSRHRLFDKRLKVVVSDSTLHDYITRSYPRLGSYEGDLVHADCQALFYSVKLYCRVMFYLVEPFHQAIIVSEIVMNYLS